MHQQPSSNQPPRGYVLKQGRVVPDPDPAAALRRIFAQRANEPRPGGA